MIVIGFLIEMDLDDVVVTPSRRPHEAAHLVQASRVYVDAAGEQLLGDVGVALQRRSELSLKKILMSWKIPHKIK